LRGLDHPLVEIGAGSGYWTALLRAAGLDIVATDLEAAIRREPHQWFCFRQIWPRGE